jgi:hypothetical protein
MYEMRREKLTQADIMSLVARQDINVNNIVRPDKCRWLYVILTVFDGETCGLLSVSKSRPNVHSDVDLV